MFVPHEVLLIYLSVSEWLSPLGKAGFKVTNIGCTWVRSPGLSKLANNYDRQPIIVIGHHFNNDLCAQIGLFLKRLGSKFSYKSSKNI